MLPIVSFPSFHFVCVFFGDGEDSPEKVGPAHCWRCQALEQGRGLKWLGMLKAPSSPTLSHLGFVLPFKLPGGFQIKIPIDWHSPRLPHSSSPAPSRRFLIHFSASVTSTTSPLVKESSLSKILLKWIEKTKCLGNPIAATCGLECETMVTIKVITRKYLLKSTYVPDPKLRTACASCSLILTITL